MMGRRQILRGGGEWDTASQKARRILIRRAGKWAFYKRMMNRRWRRELKAQTKEE